MKEMKEREVRWMLRLVGKEMTRGHEGGGEGEGGGVNIRVRRRVSERQTTKEGV